MSTTHNNPIIAAWQEHTEADGDFATDGTEWLEMMDSDMSREACEITRDWTSEHRAEARLFFALDEDEQGGYIAVGEYARSVAWARCTFDSGQPGDVLDLARYGLTVATRAALMNADGYKSGDIEEMLDNAAIECEVPMPFNRDNLHGYAAAATHTGATDPADYNYEPPVIDVLNFGNEATEAQRASLNAAYAKWKAATHADDGDDEHDAARELIEAFMNHTAISEK